jgi:hypothetical protein
MDTPMGVAPYALSSGHIDALDRWFHDTSAAARQGRESAADAGERPNGAE